MIYPTIIALIPLSFFVHILQLSLLNCHVAFTFPNSVSTSQCYFIISTPLFSDNDCNSGIAKFHTVPLQCDNVLSLCVEALIAGGATGVASIRRCQKLPQSPTEPMTVGSNTDPLLAKDEPISDGGSASVITYLRRGNKNGKETEIEREEWEYVRERFLQTARSVKKEGEDVVQTPEQRFPCNPWRRPWWGRLSPWSPRRSVMERKSSCRPWRTPR